MPAKKDDKTTQDVQVQTEQPSAPAPKLVTEMTDLERKIEAHQALLTVRRAIDGAMVKDTKAYGYKYYTLEQVIKAIEPVLLQHEFLTRFTAEPVDIFISYDVVPGTKKPSNDTPVNTQSPVVVHTMTLTHVPTGYDFIFTKPVSLGDGDSQSAGGQGSYMRRYLYTEAFGLYGVDDDGASSSPRQESIRRSSSDDSGTTDRSSGRSNRRR